MHGQHCEERQQQWHMRPGPSQRPLLATVADSSSVKCFSKAGRKIAVGDCALFQAGNAPPFIGLIRNLTSENEGNLKLAVNWLYRPGDIKLGKGFSLEAAPNEVFYSFHRDEIPAALLLHPCKVAFLQKGVELPSGVSSFVCRRVYDFANKCLYWLTDKDYTNERQEEVNQLLDRIKHEMQAAVQSGVPPQRAISGLNSSQQPKADIGSNAAFIGQGKGKKRERTDQSVDPCKCERSMKLADSDSSHSKRECNMKLKDTANFTDKDGGLSNLSGVDQLVLVMHQERNDNIKKSGDGALQRTRLASIIAATEREDCLTRFVQLGGLPVLDDWLQEAHKGRVGDGGSPKEGEKAMEELLLTLLKALDKLPVDLDALKTCQVGKSVNNLRGHRNFDIQKRARKLVDTWKKRVDVEIKLSGESKTGSNPATAWSSKQPSCETHGTKGRSVTEGGSVKSTAGVKPVSNGSCPSDTKCSSMSVSGSKESPVMSSSTISKDNPIKCHASGASEVLLAAVKEEKSSGSSQSQNTSQSWCSGSVKGAGPWKEDVKNSSVISIGTNITGTALRSHSHSGKGHSKQSLTGPQKEPPGSKLSVWNKMSGNEKVANSALLEKGAAESVRAENSNNQRLIVRLPNPGRSPARSASGGSLAEGGAPASRGSSPGALERHDSIDGKSKELSVTPAAHSPESSGDIKSGSGSDSGGKPGVDCIEEKETCCITTADDVECKSSDEHGSKEMDSYFNYSNLYAGKDPPDIVQVGVVKKNASASLVALATGDISEEVHGFDTNEGAIDLLASVAACEGSEMEKSISGVTEVQSQAKDVSRDSVKQTRHPNELELDQDENFLVVTLEDDEKWKKDCLTKPNVKSLLEPACAGKGVDPGSCPAQGAIESADDLIEQPGVSTLEQSPEERDRDGATLSIFVSADCSVGKDMNPGAVRGTEAFAGNQDLCGGAKLMRRETLNQERGSVSRLSADICNGSSLTGDCQTGTASALEDVDILEEGIEDAKQVAASSPLKMSSLGDPARAGDLVSGYYEEDALEVARQVAKEVEQEVERYGKPEAHDVNSTSVLNPSHVSPIDDSAKNSWVSPNEVNAGFKDRDHDKCLTEAGIYSDDSQETVTEKREEMEAGRIPSTQEGEEVDQVASSLHNPEKLRPALESSHGSIVDDAINRELNAVASSKEYSQSSSVAVHEESVDPTLCDVHSKIPTEKGAASTDGKCGNSDTSERPVFDLNEGLFSDEVLHDDPRSPVPSLSPAVPAPAPDSPSGLTSMPCSVAAPIAVVAAAKGAFIPPSNLLKNKGELGWKAATSAFRPAEPRRLTETIQLSSDIPGLGAATDSSGQSEKQARLLDIDLNVADDRAMEDVPQKPVLGMVMHGTSMGSDHQVHAGSLNANSGNEFIAKNSSVASRPELDLNRIDESEESMGSLMPDLRGAGVSGRSNDNFSLAATHVLRDFDLNDGPGLEEYIGEEPSLQHSNAKNLGNPLMTVLPGMRSNPELGNGASWYSVANPIHTMVMPAFSVSRTEPYPVVAAPTPKNVITMGHSLSPFNSDLYQAGAAISSSPPVSYPITVPASFPYAGYHPFGSGFPFTSASYNISSTPFVTSSNSPAFPTTPQLVSAGAVASPYGRPYLMGTEVPGAETGASWSRPNLDLNAGPDAVDADAREEGFVTRQIPPLGQLSFQQAGLSGGPSKRKEPEGGFDPFRSGFKQMTRR